MALTSAIGSDSWEGAGDEENEGKDYYDRVTKFYRSIDWKIVEARCSMVHNNVTCHLKDRFSCGYRNVVRHVVFDDGQEWVARLRMPRPSGATGQDDKLADAEIMEVEVATMRFLRLHTSIPVPRVHDFSFTNTNSIGAPYILLDYIPGTAADELRDQRDCELQTYGTKEQDRKFREQLAKFQVELASCKFDKIGSIRQSKSNPKAFEIGADVEIGKGPWTSSIEYYKDRAEYSLEHCREVKYCRWDPEKELHKERSFLLPVLFRDLMPKLEDKVANKGPFGLANSDYGANNVLVDTDFNIIALIDFDCVMAAPIEQVAQFPSLTCLEPDTPYVVQTEPAVLERMEISVPKVRAYKELIAEAERRRLEEGKGVTHISHLMLSDGAYVMQSMTEFRMHTAPCNDDWLLAYVTILNNLMDRRSEEASIASATSSEVDKSGCIVSLQSAMIVAMARVRRVFGH
ncbi:MAG: hypothetical protein M1828_006205 [Chrysothrix sp. TS-e1954]|nr:MAG: hypothetical protein M1828_006205 [Chrysothrix sp. TS-e1954]